MDPVVSGCHRIMGSDKQNTVRTIEGSTTSGVTHMIELEPLRVLGAVDRKNGEKPAYDLAIRLGLV